MHGVLSCCFKKQFAILAKLCCYLFFFIYTPFVFAAYASHISLASDWLVNQQNNDGSWGSSAAEKRLFTAEAVKAFQASGYRTTTFYKGISWLESHSVDNTDFSVRRAQALQQHGDSVIETLLSSLDIAQNTTLPQRDGWGVSESYLASPIDTATVLLGLASLGTSSGAYSVDTQAALNYLKATQIGTSGWPVSLASTADLWSTAITVQSIAQWLAQDASLSIPIAEGLAVLNAQVDVAEPDYLQALAAQAALTANDVSAAQVWLARLDNTQQVNGSWSNRIYDTALALHALAMADGNNSVANQTTVAMPDELLRGAVNAALGRNALDALTCLEISQLTSLTATGLGISDLTGLTCATNLAALDLSNNQIGDITPIWFLVGNIPIDLTGNPAEGLVPDFSLDVPIPIAFTVTFFAVVVGVTFRMRVQSKRYIHSVINT